MVMEFHFAFGTVGMNALSLDFVIVLVGKIVYYVNLELVVVGLENLVGFQEKLFYIGFFVAFDVGILVNMVQKYLVNGRHQMIHILYSGVFVVYFYFVGKRGNFHYNLVLDVDLIENLLGCWMSLVFPNCENIHYYY